MQRHLRFFRTFSWSWSAVFTGVFIGLAVETLLLLLGAAIGTSVGDGILGGGFALWSVICSMLCLGLGAAVASFFGRLERSRDGAICGALVWSVIVVAGSALWTAFGPQNVASGMWARFFGALLGLGCALIGGAIGTRLTSTSGRPIERREVITDETLPTQP